MTQYEARIDDVGISYLKSYVIGKSVFEIVSPGIFVEKDYITSPKYIFGLQEHFLEIESLWFETEHYFDYFKISFTDKLNDIQIKNHILQNGKSIRGLVYPFSSIRVCKSKALQITKILVLEKTLQSDNGQENIVYDNSIIFYQENKPGFSISVHNHMYEFLEYTNNQKLMSRLIEKLNCRFIIE